MLLLELRAVHPSNEQHSSHLQLSLKVSWISALPVCSAMRIAPHLSVSLLVPSCPPLCDADVLVTCPFLLPRTQSLHDSHTSSHFLSQTGTAHGFAAFPPKIDRLAPSSILLILLSRHLLSYSQWLEPTDSVKGSRQSRSSSQQTRWHRIAAPGGEHDHVGEWTWKFRSETLQW